MSEIYISVDVETDGPIPGDYSMLSIGAVAYTSEETKIGSFKINLLPLEGAKRYPKTMEFWEKNPEAWESLQVNRLKPDIAMVEFARWIVDTISSYERGNSLPHSLRPVFVGYPVTFDFQFIHWYFIHFLDYDPFGFQGLDLKTYAMAAMKTEFKKTVKPEMPTDWFMESKPHTHDALEDAEEQGYLFFRIREDLNWN